MNFGLELSGIAWINKLKLILRRSLEASVMNVMNLLDVGNFWSISFGGTFIVSLDLKPSWIPMGKLGSWGNDQSLQFGRI